MPAYAKDGKVVCYFRPVAGRLRAEGTDRLRGGEDRRAHEEGGELRQGPSAARGLHRSGCEDGGRDLDEGLDGWALIDCAPEDIGLEDAGRLVDLNGHDAVRQFLGHGLREQPGRGGIPGADRPAGARGVATQSGLEPRTAAEVDVVVVQPRREFAREQ